MKNNIKSRDLEMLSAYLDGQLSARQRKKLEIRLQNDADLQRALLDLRQTKNLLSRTLQVRAPRNFTLTPEMAGKPSLQVDVFSSMRLVSALASILLVLVFAGDLFTTGGQTLSSSRSMAQNEQAAPAAAMERNNDALEEGSSGFADKSGEAPLPTVSIEAEMASEEPTEEATEEIAADSDAQSESGATPELDSAGANDDAAGESPKARGQTETPQNLENALSITSTPSEVLATAPPLANRTSTQPSTETISPSPETQPSLGLVDQAEERDGEAIENLEKGKESGAVVPQSGRSGRIGILFRIFEVVLLGIVLVSGGLAYYLRRRL